ncbi:MAG: GIY-YIG nuclease family protein [Geodermatophilaceae bacterium]|nr:GIY-YIG nuclease family protein [Geodermatophilaceae bacterium]
MSESDVVVYAIVREDLRECYIGQTQNLDGRLHKHQLSPKRKHLWDGKEPWVWIMGRFAECGPHVTVHESECMDVMAARGYVVLSQKGGGVHIGKAAGPLGAAATQARRKVDPEFDTRFRESLRKGGREGGRKGGTATQARRKIDPEFDAQCREFAGKGGPAATERRKNDSELAARYSATCSNNASARFTCAECDYVTTAMCMTRHHKASGHSGKTRVTERHVLQVNKRGTVDEYVGHARTTQQWFQRAGPDEFVLGRADQEQQPGVIDQCTGLLAHEFG